MNSQQGYHIICDLFYCQNKDALIDHRLFLNTLMDKIKSSGMTPLGLNFHYFGEPFESPYTLIIMLAESHISFHTFDKEEEGLKCSFDIYTCSLTKDNSVACEAVYDYILEVFKPLEKKGELFIRRN